MSPHLLFRFDAITWQGSQDEIEVAAWPLQLGSETSVETDLAIDPPLSSVERTSSLICCRRLAPVRVAVEGSNEVQSHESNETILRGGTHNRGYDAEKRGYRLEFEAA